MKEDDVYYIYSFRHGQMNRLKRLTWQQAFETARDLRSQGWQCAVHKVPKLVVEMQQEEPS